MKLTSKITAGAAAAFIGVFALLTVLGTKNKYSQAENRPLAELPELTWESIADGGLGRGLVTYTADHFPGRSSWLSASARMRSGVGESIVNGVYIADSRLVSAEHQPDLTSETVSAVNRFSVDYEGAIYFAAIPTSAGIYGDILPSYLRRSTEKQKIDSLYSQLDPDVKKIDAYSILKMLSDNYIYYRSDDKWTSYGAYCVYRTVIQKLGFMPVSYDKYTIRHVVDSYRGDLYSRTQYMKCKPDLLDMYEYKAGAEVTSCIGYDSGGNAHECSLYDMEAAASGSGYDLYLGERMPVIEITTTVNNDRRLLVIGDEYADCFIPFLTQHYSSITVLTPDPGEAFEAAGVSPSDYEQTLFLFGIGSVR